MKYIFLFILLSGTVFPVSAQKGGTELHNTVISGYLGKRIDACIASRVQTQDVEHLVEPFRFRNETALWQTEFLGKWMLGAVGSYRYNGDSGLLEKITLAVGQLLETQTDDGYIGNYAPDHQLGQWDIWGRKYTLLGLLAYYDLTGDRKVLKACCRMADHLLSQVGDGPGRQDIVKTGNYRGMPSSSILEPIVLLYRRTGERKYLDFAGYIVSRWETPDGPQLVRKALAEIPVAQRFSHPASWWSWENGQKAYEMMSCYEGLLELYKVGRNPQYLKAVIAGAKNIMDTEINAAGSGSAFECWYGGREKQSLPAYHTMETCVTMTWMKFCSTLLDITGDPAYADQIERTVYNALLASLKDDASQIVKYSPLEGRRTEGEEQCGMHINCCNANGPRAFALIPDIIYRWRDSVLRINLYVSSETTLQLHGVQLRVIQRTAYPCEGRVEIDIAPSRTVRTALALRIPGWSEKTELSVNGIPVEDVKCGTYVTLDRVWEPGDKVVLSLDMRARVMTSGNTEAIVRGPVLLARDSRFEDGDVDEALVLEQENGRVELTPAIKPGAFAWMEFSVPVTAGTDLEGKDAARTIRMCDFSSAGNDWSPAGRYRVWLPRTLNVMRSDYKKY